MQSSRRAAELSAVGVGRYVVLPIIGACVTLYMLTQLSTVSLTIGLCWLAIGVAYLLWLTRVPLAHPPS